VRQPLRHAVEAALNCGGHRAIGNDSNRFQRYVGGLLTKWKSRFDRGSMSSRIIRLVPMSPQRAEPMDWNKSVSREPARR
jgi:hypothetical protein